MRSAVIIEPLGRMCQDLPKDGSHFLCQINSKQHSKAFRHLVKGPPSNSQLTHGQDGQHIFAEKWRVSQGAIVEEPTPDAGACGTQTR